MKDDYESDVEKECCEWSQRRRWKVYKIKSGHPNGLPDRFFVRKGVIIFVEFKRDGEEPTEQQLRRHKELREEGMRVEVIDNFKDFRAIFI